MASADIQWLFYSGERIVAHGPLVITPPPDIRSMWGYIVFAFPFVRLFVHTFVRSSFCHRVKVFALKFMTSYFEDPLMDFIHIWHDGRYRSKVFISTIPTPGVTLGSRSQNFHKKESFLCLSLYSYIIKTLEEFHLYLTCW